jgi:hypothetical protein
MSSINLKIALVIYGALYIALGIVLLVAPDRAGESLYGFTSMNDSLRYLMAIGGAAFITAGVWFAMTFLDPVRNINSVRFAILWAGLMFIVPLFALSKGYIEVGQIWLGLIINAVFAAAFLIYYPRGR